MKSIPLFTSLLFIFLFFQIQNVFAQDITSTVTSNGKFLIKDEVNRDWLDIQRGKFYVKNGVGGPGSGILFEVLGTAITNRLFYSNTKFLIQSYGGLNIYEVSEYDITNRLSGSYKINNASDSPLFEVSNSSGAKFYLNGQVYLDVSKTYGSISLGNENRPTGPLSICMGYNNTASGYHSIAIGDTTVSTGMNSISIGKGSTASGIFSIAIGTSVQASGNNSLAIGQDISTNSHLGAFVMGSSGGLGINSSADYQMTMVFDGGYRLFSDATGTFGVSLAPLGTSWTVISDSTKKEKFLYADGEYFLNGLSKLHLGSWNYKNQDPAIYRHYGPMAQDIFHYFGKDEFGVIGNDTSLATADMDGIMMICLQALEKRTSELQKENEQLKTELNELKEIKEELAEIRNLKEELSKQIKILKVRNESDDNNVSFLDN